MALRSYHSSQSCNSYEVPFRFFVSVARLIKRDECHLTPCNVKPLTTDRFGRREEDVGDYTDSTENWKVGILSNSLFPFFGSIIDEESF